VYTLGETLVPEPLPTRAVIRFEDYVLDVRSGELHKSGAARSSFRNSHFGFWRCCFSTPATWSRVKNFAASSGLKHVRRQTSRRTERRHCAILSGLNGLHYQSIDDEIAFSGIQPRVFRREPKRCDI
jgi:hypothetical protein